LSAEVIHSNRELFTVSVDKQPDFSHMADDGSAMIGAASETYDAVLAQRRRARVADE
jgi:hypothetical protein